MNIEKLNLNCEECIGNPEETKLDVAVMRITIGATEYLLCRRHAEQLSQALGGALGHRQAKLTEEEQSAVTRGQMTMVEKAMMGEKGKS
jgi:hypothetical protein